MSDIYNNSWNNDDYQNDKNSSNEQYFTYNETYLDKKKEKKSKKPMIKFIALLTATALLGSLITCAAFSLFLPQYIEGKLKNNINLSSNNSQNNFVPTTTGPVDSNSGVAKENGTLSVVDISKKVGPAVVGIVSTIPTQTFFGMAENQGSGSGIIISNDGYVVTNNHVIEGASKVEVYLSSGDKKNASLVGFDARTDLAVLKLEKGEYPYAEFGDSSNLEVGELCVAIGNPLGMEFAGSVTVGYISAVNRTVEAEGKTLNLIQTDAAINAGNSGGALVNTKGQIIGINTLKIASTGVEGLGFAIPVDEAKPVFDDLINHGYVKGRPVIGIVGRDISADIAKYYNYPEGIFVEQVQQGSGAAKAGIRRGDIIMKADGKRVKTVEELNKVRDTKKAGQIVKVELDRSGDIITVDITLGEEKTK